MSGIGLNNKPGCKVMNMEYQAGLNAYFKQAAKFRRENKLNDEAYVYERAMEYVEKECGRNHPELIPVLERYAQCLRKQNRDGEAEQLESKINEIQREHPTSEPKDSTPDQERLPKFLRQLPSLPVEFRAIKGRGSCKLTEDGIEYRELGVRCFFRWSDVDEVILDRNRSMEFGGRDLSVTVKSGGKEIKVGEGTALSIRFGPDDIVLMMRIIRLRSAPNAKLW